MKSTSLSLALVITLAASSLLAHHNMSALFDFNQRFTRTGTLTKADWRNPHIWLAVDAKSDQDQAETWLFEGPAPKEGNGGETSAATASVSSSPSMSRRVSPRADIPALAEVHIPSHLLRALSGAE